MAGVISPSPASRGERGEGRVLVATTGRVKVKSMPVLVQSKSAPAGASDREGYAMKSMPVDVGGVRIHRPGTLIGKALEPRPKGMGEILVLLSMQ